MQAYIHLQVHETQQKNLFRAVENNVLLPTLFIVCNKILHILWSFDTSPEYESVPRSLQLVKHI